MLESRPTDARGRAPEDDEFRRSPLLALEFAGSDLVLVDCSTTHRYAVTPALVAMLAGLSTWTSGNIAATGDLPLEATVAANLCLLGVLQRRSAVEDAKGTDEVGEWHPADLDLLLQRQTDDPGRYCGPPRSEGTCIRDPLVMPMPSPRPLPAEALRSVLGRRRSRRDYRDESLGLEDLSDLLHHASRRTPWFHDPALGDHALHPYPGAGARGELELHVVANDVSRLPRNAYHYDPIEHLLRPVGAPDDDRQKELGAWVLRALARPDGVQPQIVILVTAVLSRLTKKYGRLGVLLVHQDLGALYQTLYLVATVLGLAPCAVGTGPGAWTSEWLGIDSLRQPEVGCFAVGVPATMPADGRPDA